MSDVQHRPGFPRRRRHAQSRRELAELQALGLELPAGLPAASEELVVGYSLTLAGARDLRILPLARTTVVELSGTWRDPSFGGAALSEHVGFGPAYAVGAAASVSVVGGYAAAVLGARRRALMLAALQSAA